MHVLEVSKIERELQIHGVPVEYKRSVPCQCQGKNFAEPKFNCTICFGSGVRWIDPAITTIGEALAVGNVSNATTNTVTLSDAFDGKNDLTRGRTVKITAGMGVGQALRINSYNNATKIAVLVKNWTVVPNRTSMFEVRNTLKALITTRDTSKDRKETGVWETGMANCTLPSEIIPADNDKITVLTDRIVVNNEVFQKGETYPNGVTKERVRLKQVVTVEDVRTLNDVFTYGVDVTINANGVIVWTGNHVPAVKEQYTIRYIAVPEYFIFRNAPRFRQDGGALMPHMIKIMRLDRYTPGNANAQS